MVGEPSQVEVVVAQERLVETPRVLVCMVCIDVAIEHRADDDGEECVHDVVAHERRLQEKLLTGKYCDQCWTKK